MTESRYLISRLKRIFLLFLPLPVELVATSQTGRQDVPSTLDKSTRQWKLFHSTRLFLGSWRCLDRDKRHKLKQRERERERERKAVKRKTKVFVFMS